MLRWRLEERAMSTTPPSPRDTEALPHFEKWRGVIGRAKIEKQ
jgi:hypothetical protein